MEVYLFFLKTYVFGEYFNYICLAVLTLLLLVNALHFTLKNFRTWYKKSLNFILLLLFVLTFGEFLTAKRIFVEGGSCFIAFFSIVLLQCAIYYFLSPLKTKKKLLKKVEISEIKSDYGTVIKRAVERIKTAEELPQVLSGFVDVGYIKSLINTLKKGELEQADSQEIEEFEVYLLNFVNRQPTNSERQEMSARLNSLIKKLAKYA